MTEQLQRLFTGLAVPTRVCNHLQALQPRAGPKVRPTPPAQVHVTLQFIGQAEPKSVIAAIADLGAEPFVLEIDRLGAFGSPRRGGILWAGIREHPQLSALHAAMGQRLAGVGLANDTRPYTPHITLARCRHGCPRAVFDRFLSQPLPDIPSFPVSEWILFSSETGPQGAVYQRQFSKELIVAGAGKAE